jgi:hypothetical protein
MGLYMATIGLWLWGAFRGGLSMRTALIAEIVFISVLAIGRLLDNVLDGWRSPMLIAYTVAELGLAIWGVFCLRRFHRNPPVTEH